MAGVVMYHGLLKMEQGTPGSGDNGDQTLFSNRAHSIMLEGFWMFQALEATVGSAFASLYGSNTPTPHEVARSAIENRQFEALFSMVGRGNRQPLPSDSPGLIKAGFRHSTIIDYH